MSRKLRQSRMAYLLTTFPKTSETFVQREIRGLRRAGLDFDLFTIWGGGSAFESRPVNQFYLIELVLVPVWLIYWFVRRPRVVTKHLIWMFTRPTSWLNYQETWLGYGFGLVRAQRFVRSYRKVHAGWATMPATAALLIHDLTGLPFSIGAHAYDIFYRGGDGLLPEKIESAVFTHSSNVAAQSALIERFPDLAEKMYVVRRSLDPMPVFQWTGLRNHGEPESIHFISVGRLIPKKGFDRLIDLIVESERQGLDWSLAIVGDGPERVRLEADIKANHMEERISLLGGMDYTAVESCYTASDAFLFAGVVSTDGDRDGLPNVIPEAMAVGLPVFAQPAPGVLEAVIDQATGFLTDFSETGDAVRLIDQALRTDSLGKVVHAARSWVETAFSVEANSQRLMALHLDE